MPEGAAFSSVNGRSDHALYDLGRWCLDPEDIEVVPATGHDLSSLQVQQSNLHHLKQAPDGEALDGAGKRNSTPDDKK